MGCSMTVCSTCKLVFDIQAAEKYNLTMHSEGQPAVLAQPVLEVGYYAEEGRSFFAVVRSIGMLAILIGGSMLLYVVAALVPMGSAFGTRYGANSWMEMVYYIASAAVGIGLIVAGIGCLVGRPRGRRFLIMAAWGLLLVQLFAVVATAWMMLTRGGSGLSISPLVSVIASLVRAACSGIAFPVIVLVLTRHASIRKVFEVQ